MAHLIAPSAKSSRQPRQGRDRMGPPSSPVEKSGTSWRAAIDPVSGRTYYYNSASRLSSWEKPAELQTYEHALIQQHSPEVKREKVKPRSLADALASGACSVSSRPIFSNVGHPTGIPATTSGMSSSATVPVNIGVFTNGTASLTTKMELSGSLQSVWSPSSSSSSPPPPCSLSAATSSSATPTAAVHQQQPAVVPLNSVPNSHQPLYRRDQVTQPSFPPPSVSSSVSFPLPGNPPQSQCSLPKSIPPRSASSTAHPISLAFPHQIQSAPQSKPTVGIKRSYSDVGGITSSTSFSDAPRHKRSRSLSVSSSSSAPALPLCAENSGKYGLVPEPLPAGDYSARPSSQIGMPLPPSSKSLDSYQRQIRNAVSSAEESLVPLYLRRQQQAQDSAVASSSLPSAGSATPHGLALQRNAALGLVSLSAGKSQPPILSAAPRSAAASPAPVVGSSDARPSSVNPFAPVSVSSAPTSSTQVPPPPPPLLPVVQVQPFRATFPYQVDGGNFSHVSGFMPRKHRASQAEQQQRWASGDPRWRKKLWKCDFCHAVINRNMKSKHPCLDPSRRGYAQYHLNSFLHPQPHCRTPPPHQAQPTVFQRSSTQPPILSQHKLPRPTHPVVQAVTPVPLGAIVAQPVSPSPPGAPAPRVPTAPTPVGCPPLLSKPVQRTPVVPVAGGADQPPPPPPPVRRNAPPVQSVSQVSATPLSSPPAVHTPPAPVRSGSGVTEISQSLESTSLVQPRASVSSSASPSSSTSSVVPMCLSESCSALPDCGSQASASVVSKPCTPSMTSAAIKVSSDEQVSTQTTHQPVLGSSAPKPSSTKAPARPHVSPAAPVESPKTPLKLVGKVIDDVAPATHLPSRSSTPLLWTQSAGPNSPAFGPQCSMEFAGVESENATPLPPGALGSPLSSPVAKHKPLKISSSWQGQDPESLPANFLGTAHLASPVTQHTSISFRPSLSLFDGSSPPAARLSEAGASLSPNSSPFCRGVTPPDHSMTPSPAPPAVGKLPVEDALSLEIDPAPSDGQELNRRSSLELALNADEMLAASPDRSLAASPMPRNDSDQKLHHLAPDDDALAFSGVAPAAPTRVTGGERRASRLRSKYYGM